MSIAPYYTREVHLRDVINDLLMEIGACLCVTLEDWELPDTCFCGVVPGAQAAIDYFGGCDDESTCGNGMAWVRLAGLYPAAAVGVVNQSAGNCGVTLGIDLEIGVVRCIRPGEDDGSPIPGEELAASAYLQSQDALAMRAALACCSPLTSRDYIMGIYTPFGPEGAMVGGTWSLVVTI